MKAYLIDPELSAITTIHFSGDVSTMRALLGCSRIMEVVPQSGPLSDSIYVGDFRDGRDEPEHWFLLDVYPISGRALVLGVAKDYSDCDASIGLEDLTKLVTWAELKLLYQERDIDGRRRPLPAQPRRTPPVDPDRPLPTWARPPGQPGTPPDPDKRPPWACQAI